METAKLTISEIKAANKAAGLHFFERSTMRFFNSKVERAVYSGPGGVYFITSEQFVDSRGHADPRKYTVRRFQPTGECSTPIGQTFNEMSLEDARAEAKRLSQRA